MKKSVIKIIGAQQHNLKNLNLEIPQNRITVVTGVSGSGKSSLAFDTLYAEGQRRYIETFSPYARQFMDRMDRPHVDRIENIPPAIAIDRKDPVRTSRSTVGTMTELTDYVKLLFARLGRLHCRECGRPVIRETPEDVWKKLKNFPQGSELIIAFPSDRWESASGDQSRGPVPELGRMGFTRVFRNNRIESLDAWDPAREGDIAVVVDRVMWRSSDRERIMDSLEQAFRYGKGRIELWIRSAPMGGPSGGDRGGYENLVFSSNLECPACGISYRDPVPNLFSFNSPLGACETCRGFGRTIDIDLEMIIPDPGLSLREGAIKPWGSWEDGRMEFEDLMRFCRRKKIPVDIPFQSLKSSQREEIIEGTKDFYGIRGFFRWLETKTYKMHVRVYLSRYRSYMICPACRGTRFRDESLLYRVGDFHIGGIYAMSVKEASGFFGDLRIPAGDKAGLLILDEIKNRLRYLLDVGLGYLTLDRQSRNLSGGEVQRVALTSALGSSLVNSLYILDEPSIGLHPRDNHRLIRILEGLRDIQNTVIVVEHDPEIISRSDMMLDLGPGAGERGGRVTYFGPVGRVNGSLTGDYLRGRKSIDPPARRRLPRNERILIEGASENNLREVDIEIPLGLFVCLTGVSGSGKSTLAEEIIYKGIKRLQGDSKGRPGSYRNLRGWEGLEDVVLVDQRPIGRSPRGNLLTYTKAMDHVRRILAETDSARALGLGPGDFSFNVPGGRCETCKGEGFEKVEMQFLSDVFLTCPACGGKRFKEKVLKVEYKGLNIDRIFSLTVDRAAAFFKDNPKISRSLQPLREVGLGYMRLGQPINTLSGGEAQRLKLSRYLGPEGAAHRLFIFDEPTTGLHFEDIKLLLKALHGLVDRGNSILVIEHNMDVIKTADWVIDLGPEGGDEGGRVVEAGPPERLAENRISHTGRFLHKYLSGTDHLAVSHDPVDETNRPLNSGSVADSIIIRGAREHNLRNLNLTIPRHKLVVITGVSGSGKSSLAYDVLFSEGQRRYLESLAPYVRQYMKVLERPDVDSITGLPPTVAIQQRISHSGRRSTVGTLTEIYHFLRLLFSKLGVRNCPGCGRPFTTRTAGEILEEAARRFGSVKGMILAPKIAGRKGFHKELLDRAVAKGYREARIDGRLTRLKTGMALSRYHEHTIDLVIGRFPGALLEDLVPRALAEGEGSVIITEGTNGKEEIFSMRGVCPSCGIGISEPDPRLFSFNSRYGACRRCDGLGIIGEGYRDRGLVCPECGGSRLKPEALAITVDGRSIRDLVSTPVERLYGELKDLEFSGGDAAVGGPVLSEILTRLSFLKRLGLSYLTLDRSGDSLSGGEAQRIRLAAQLGSNLTGVCYILDEPTIGLHARDNRMLLDALLELKKRGNSILLVEHDEETIRTADYIIDLGPGAAHQGGRVVAQGRLSDLKKNPDSVTGVCFNGPGHAITSRLRPYRKLPAVVVEGASSRNLRNIRARFPLGTLICVTGVSGSGKSTLVKETLYKGLGSKLDRRSSEGLPCRDILGWEAVDRILEVDHSPIGRTPRSVPASYVGFLNQIRALLAGTPLARARGFGPGRFSFNVAGGRCEACKGHGFLKVEMNFLPDVYILCEVCRGRRFNQETLNITYKGRNISQILDMTFEEASSFFSAVPSIRRAASVVSSIGLGYLKLGQPSPTLSGGEAQRIKLAEELSRPPKGHTFFILDEPSTGLHLSDIQKLTGFLQDMVDQGNTIAVIEHNMEIIKEADYIIDLGPEGGEGGGRVVATGSPVEILKKCKRSHTAEYLRRYIDGG